MRHRHNMCVLPLLFLRHLHSFALPLSFMFSMTGTSQVLRGFWACGRVRGDRSVFVTSHRPVHFSRALMFSLARTFVFRTEAIFLFAHLPARCTSMSLDLELANILEDHNQGIATGVRTGVFV